MKKLSLLCEEIGIVEEDGVQKFYATFKDKESGAEAHIFFPEKDIPKAMIWKEFEGTLYKLPETEKAVPVSVLEKYIEDLKSAELSERVSGAQTIEDLVLKDLRRIINYQAK